MADKNLFDGLTYEEAMEKLKLIVLSLENGEISIDQLGETIDYGNDLVDFCQDKLRNITGKLDQNGE